MARRPHLYVPTSYIYFGSLLTVVPQTILSPAPFLVFNLVPQDSLHPLYSDTPENSALRTEFLLDYLVQEPISVYDRRIIRSEGFTVTNLAKKSLVFKVNDAGKCRYSLMCKKLVTAR